MTPAPIELSGGVPREVQLTRGGRVMASVGAGLILAAIATGIVLTIVYRRAVAEGDRRVREADLAGRYLADHLTLDRNAGARPELVRQTVEQRAVLENRDAQNL